MGGGRGSEGGGRTDVRAAMLLVPTTNVVAGAGRWTTPTTRWSLDWVYLAGEGTIAKP